MVNVKLCGRGGQGIVVGSKVLAYAAYLSGLNVKAIPSYGAERRGAPVFANVRMSEKEIKTYNIDSENSKIIVCDSIVGKDLVSSNIKNISGVINSKSYSDKINKGLIICPANKVAREYGLIKSGILMVNILMVGYYIKNFSDIGLKNLKGAIQKIMNKNVADKNINALNAIFQEREI